MHKEIVIAVDGTAASGKGTLSKRLAKKLGYEHLDTGKLYRAIAKISLDNNKNLENEKDLLDCIAELNDFDLSCNSLTAENIARSASKVAKNKMLREALIDYQRDFPNNKEGVVIDGRDIGSVIFPNAQYKFFVTATPEIRAKRRHLEHLGTSNESPYEEILNDVKKRDYNDMNRKVAPLVVAEDSHVLDTSNLTIDQVVNEALKYISKKS